MDNLQQRIERAKQEDQARARAIEALEGLDDATLTQIKAILDDGGAMSLTTDQGGKVVTPCPEGCGVQLTAVLANGTSRKPTLHFIGGEGKDDGKHMQYLSESGERNALVPFYDIEQGAWVYPEGRLSA